MSANGCSVRVYGHNQPFGGAWCSKPAKVEINGKHYCATHDPAAELRRRQKADAKYHAQAQVAQQKHAAQKEMKRRADCYETLLSCAKTTMNAIDDEGKLEGHGDEYIYDCLGSALSGAYFAARAAIAKAQP